MIGTWRVVVEGARVEMPGGLSSQGDPVEVEVEVAEAGGRWAASLYSCEERATEARVAVVQVAARHGLPVLEILDPDEMNRTEEVADHVARAQFAYSGWLEQRLAALIEEAKALELTVRHGTDDEPQEGGQ